MPSATINPTGTPWESIANRTLLFSLSCAGYRLASTSGASAVRIGLDLAGFNHQAFEIGDIHDCFQQPGPLALVSPAPFGYAQENRRWVSSSSGSPGQIAQGSAGSQNPEHGVEKAAAVIG